MYSPPHPSVTTSSSSTPLPPPPPLLPSLGQSPSAVAAAAPPPPRVEPPLQRRAVVQRPTISTALAAQHATHLQPHTPISATTLSTPFSPYAASSLASLPSTAPSTVASPLNMRPSSFVSPYNPQEWSRSGPVGGSYVPYIHPQQQQQQQQQQPAGQNRPTELTGLEAALPSPPPPYSPSVVSQTAPSPSNPPGHHYPPQSVSPSTVRSSTYSSPVASSSRTPSGFEYGRPSPSTVAQSVQSSPGPSFPPPPPQNGRDRSISRNRSDRSLFSLSALTHRNRSSEQPPVTNAIDTLHHQTSEALSRAPAAGSSHASSSTQYHVSNTPAAHEQQWVAADLRVRAPTARRAASTGAIGHSSVQSRTRFGEESSSPGSSWEPGMPLPPPPPGPPPPSGSRSASMSRTTDYTSPSSSRSNLAAPAPRRQYQHAPTLAPVPPTPADWADRDSRSRSRSPAARGLHIDTSNMRTIPGHQRTESHSAPAETMTEPHTAHPSSSSSGLTRTPAQRDSSARGIRERRSESRAARQRLTETQSAIEPSNNPWAEEMEAAERKPADLVLFSKNGGLSQRRQGKAPTPTSNTTIMSPSAESQPGSSTRRTYGSSDLQGSSSNQTTPKIVDEQRRVLTSPDMYAQTPPFSPAPDRSSSRSNSVSLPPKALPTPPPQHLGDAQSSNLLLPSVQPHDRPVSHILHVPNEDNSMPAPLSPARPPSATLKSPDLPSSQLHSAADLTTAVASKTQPSSPESHAGIENNTFAQGCIERHKAFIERELGAETDQQRLELFAEFIVTESRIRRDRYSAAFDLMASDILDLTRDMWRSYNGSTGRRSATPNTAAPKPASSWRSQSSVTDSSETHMTAASPASSRAGNYTPRTEPDSPSSIKSQHRTKPETALWSGYQPCLSPIPSMAMSTVPDEEDSRGRSASRWWEESANGSLGRGGKKIERSARESKYMGVPKEAREYLQYEDSRTPNYSPGPLSGQQQSYGPNEYPPEKFGWHESEQLQQPPMSGQSFLFNSSAPTTPDPYRLDVSRLVTLPPPYPRHYPAVNNNHPDLSSIRATLRALGDLEDAIATKNRFKENIAAQHEHDRNDVNERRTRMRIQIQDRIHAGEISFAEAANAEAEFDAREAKRIQDRAKAEFDGYGRAVMSPLNNVFSERVKKATAAIETLRKELFSDARQTSMNEPQEEGDEQPELLEKLTLLKWLFEIREQLHRELFDLEGERNNRYKTVILTPYIQVNNADKIKEVEDFFSQDAQERKNGFEKEALQRFEEFMQVIEENVTRGVEMQLSAFWDIAPGLLAVVQKIPDNLFGFNVVIPLQEFDENPSYHSFPLQYLYTLLVHAGKSTYQFIESQTNLLCLLHEVKTGVMTAGSRLLETQRYLAGEDYASVDAEMKAIRQDEEARLTVDLKEKVGLVEGQWEEALGKRLDDCKKHVEQFLIEQGGWDDSLQE